MRFPFVKSDEIREIGERLRTSDIKTISTTEFFTLLRKATNTSGMDVLKGYLRMLRDDGYVRFTNTGQWEIIHDAPKKEKPIVEKKDQPIQTEDELEQKLKEIKTAKILNPMEETRRIAFEKDEQKRKQQIYQLVATLESAKKEEQISEKTGIFVLWTDAYEYHVVCAECYREAKNTRKGKGLLADILAFKPKVCEYCGAKLEKDNDTTEE